MDRVIGDAGPTVLLVPGGAEAVDGFFPGLAEGLVADPGARVVLHDRPGTVGSDVPGGLMDAADDLHEHLRRRGLAPAVVVGQSLGGAVALLLAAEHPDDVAGLVLLDPTPVNDPPQAARVATTARRVASIARFPPAGAGLRALIHRGARTSAARHAMRPDVRAALLRTAGADLSRLADAAAGLPAAAARFTVATLPEVPAVVVTADRKPDDPVRRAHVRLAEQLGAQLRTWHGAEHAVHLTHPDEVLATCREIVRTVAGPPPS